RNPGRRAAGRCPGCRPGQPARSESRAMAFYRRYRHRRVFRRRVADHSCLGGYCPLDLSGLGHVCGLVRAGAICNAGGPARIYRVWRHRAGGALWPRGHGVRGRQDAGHMRSGQRRGCGAHDICHSSLCARPHRPDRHGTDCHDRGSDSRAGQPPMRLTIKTLGRRWRGMLGLTTLLGVGLAWWPYALIGAGYSFLYSEAGIVAVRKNLEDVRWNQDANGSAVVMVKDNGARWMMHDGYPSLLFDGSGRLVYQESLIGAGLTALLPESKRNKALVLGFGTGISAGV